jgi:hypothetical protein
MMHAWGRNPPRIPAFPSCFGPIRPPFPAIASYLAPSYGMKVRFFASQCWKGLKRGFVGILA